MVATLIYIVATDCLKQSAEIEPIQITRIEKRIAGTKLDLYMELTIIRLAILVPGFVALLIISKILDGINRLMEALRSAAEGDMMPA